MKSFIERLGEFGAWIYSEREAENFLAFPNLPSVIVVPVAVPLLPFPLASLTVDPLVSFMWRRRTVLASGVYSPGKRVLADVVKLHTDDHPLVPPAFVALTRQ
ncbi:MAG: hypothetical protein Q8O03_06445 [Nanoarchaeota archaeon]|nr:hypothetical protein [Nanoarchaeota archaeon]